MSGRLGTFYDKAMLGMDSVGLGIFTSLGVMSGIDNGYPDNTFCWYLSACSPAWAAV